MIDLDHAATAPMRPEALAAMRPFLVDRVGNPASAHAVGEHAAAVLAEARARVAAVLGVRAGDVVFTSGGTEANNLAVKGIVLGALDRRGPDAHAHLVTTPIEHTSILEPARHLARWHRVTTTAVPVAARTGRVDPDAVAAAVTDDTALVSVGLANNEVGTVQDLAAIVAAVRERGSAWVHTDAVQAAGWLPLRDLGVDALSLSGHKFGGPRGTGVLAVRGRIPLEPVLHGGGQERGRRSGTVDVAGAVGLAVALERADAERATRAAQTAAVRDVLIAAVLASPARAALTGDPVHRLSSSASFVFDGVMGETVLLELERRGVTASSGSACAAGHTDASHVLRALGFDDDRARSAVRLTFGHTGALPDPRALAAAVVDAVTAVRSGP